MVCSHVASMTNVSLRISIVSHVSAVILWRRQRIFLNFSSSSLEIHKSRYLRTLADAHSAWIYCNFLVLSDSVIILCERLCGFLPLTTDKRNSIKGCPQSGAIEHLILLTLLWVCPGGWIKSGVCSDSKIQSLHYLEGIHLFVIQCKCIVINII